MNIEKLEENEIEITSFISCKLVRIQNNDSKNSFYNIFNYSWVDIIHFTLKSKYFEFH